MHCFCKKKRNVEFVSANVILNKNVLAVNLNDSLNSEKIHGHAIINKNLLLNYQNNKYILLKKENIGSNHQKTSKNSCEKPDFQDPLYYPYIAKNSSQNSPKLD